MIKETVLEPDLYLLSLCPAEALTQAQEEAVRECSRMAPFLHEHGAWLCTSHKLLQKLADYLARLFPGLPHSRAKLKLNLLAQVFNSKAQLLIQGPFASPLDRLRLMQGRAILSAGPCQLYKLLSKYCHQLPEDRIVVSTSESMAGFWNLLFRQQCGILDGRFSLCSHSDLSKKNICPDLLIIDEPDMVSLGTVEPLRLRKVLVLLHSFEKWSLQAKLTAYAIVRPDVLCSPTREALLQEQQQQLSKVQHKLLYNRLTVQCRPETGFVFTVPVKLHLHEKAKVEEYSKKNTALREVLATDSLQQIYRRFESSAQFIAMQDRLAVSKLPTLFRMVRCYPPSLLVYRSQALLENLRNSLRMLSKVLVLNEDTQEQVVPTLVNYFNAGSYDVAILSEKSAGALLPSLRKGRIMFFELSCQTQAYFGLAREGWQVYLLNCELLTDKLIGEQVSKRVAAQARQSKEVIEILDQDYERRPKEETRERRQRFPLEQDRGKRMEIVIDDSDENCPAEARLDSPNNLRQFVQTIRDEDQREPGKAKVHSGERMKETSLQQNSQISYGKWDTPGRQRKEERKVTPRSQVHFQNRSNEYREERQVTPRREQVRTLAHFQNRSNQYREVDVRILLKVDSSSRAESQPNIVLRLVPNVTVEVGER